MLSRHLIMGPHDLRGKKATTSTPFVDEDCVRMGEGVVTGDDKGDDGSKTRSLFAGRPEWKFKFLV